jgi:Zn ribbon nucleic-acid-binding protein
MAETQVLTKTPPSVAMTKHGFSPQTLDEAYRFSQGLARSNFVPEQYRGKPDDCLIALDLAARLGTHWMAILQHVYIVHGRPGMDANLSIGLVNQSGQFDPIQYEVEGQDARAKDYRVRAYSKRVGSPIVLYGPWIDWELVRAEKWDGKDGSKWKSMPEQMFHYRAGAWWQKRHCPEMTLGMSTTDEIADSGPSTQYVESKTLEPTQGRQAFGPKKGEQPPENFDPTSDSPKPNGMSTPSQTGSLGETTGSDAAEDGKARLCPACNTQKTGKFFRSNGRLVCRECLARANGTQVEPTSQSTSPPQTQTEQSDATDPQGPQEGVTEPQDGQAAASVPETPKEPVVTVSCKFGHLVARTALVPSPLLNPGKGEIGLCPTCKANGRVAIVKEGK